MKTFWKDTLIENLKLLAIVGLATLMGRLFVRFGFPETNIVVIYILAVLLVARFTAGYIYGFLAAVISMLCFNYFFTAPYYTFAVYDPTYFITFTIMAITAFVTSALTTKEKFLTREAQERGLESQILYMLSSRLSDAADIEDVIKVATESVSSLLQTNVGYVYLGRQNDSIYIQQVEGSQIHRSTVGVENLREKMTDLRTEYLLDEEAYNYPVNGHERLLAVLRIDKNVGPEILKTRGRLLHSIIENIAMTIERIEITVDRIKDRENMERERERANLLRAISHDLRTPLSGIMGTSEILLDMTEDQDQRKGLIRGIYQDADWLRSLVENILSLTRLQDGKVVVHKEMEAMEEVIACAVAHVEKTSPGREIQVEMPDEFHLVPMDARLIEQVITNLLNNAVKHTKETERITVAVDYTDTEVWVRVQDSGEGIAGEDEKHIFQIFYTSQIRATDVRKGIGLGLTICQTVVQAHGGTIRGGNRKDGKGAEFIFTLPLKKEENV